MFCQCDHMWNRTRNTDWYWKFVCKPDQLSICLYVCLLYAPLQDRDLRPEEMEGTKTSKAPSLPPSVFFLIRLPFKPKTFFMTVKICAFLYRAAFKSTSLTLPSHWMAAMWRSRDVFIFYLNWRSKRRIILLFIILDNLGTVKLPPPLYFSHLTHTYVGM